MSTPFFPLLVHLMLCCRIDRLTSGVLMLARSPEALLDLHAQFRKGEVNKEYIARVKVWLSRVHFCD